MKVAADGHFKATFRSRKTPYHIMVLCIRKETIDITAVKIFGSMHIYAQTKLRRQDLNRHILAQDMMIL